MIPLCLSISWHLPQENKTTIGQTGYAFNQISMRKYADEQAANCPAAT
jgi:hypothetical protein